MHILRPTIGPIGSSIKLPLTRGKSLNRGGKTPLAIVNLDHRRDVHGVRDWSSSMDAQDADGTMGSDAIVEWKSELTTWELDGAKDWEEPSGV